MGCLLQALKQTLLREPKRKLGLAVIFVTHNIGVAVEVADRIAVMYGGGSSRWAHAPMSFATRRIRTHKACWRVAREISVVGTTAASARPMSERARRTPSPHHAALDYCAAQKQRFDAVILACFGDPGLGALQDIADVPVSQTSHLDGRRSQDDRCEE